MDETHRLQRPLSGSRTSQKWSWCAELVQEEDSAKKDDDPKRKLDDAVQDSVRTHGINVQRYWNGAVSNIYLLHLFENFSR